MPITPETALYSSRCRALLVALIADALLGDPPNAWHPVVWMGRWMKHGEHYAPGGTTQRLVYGAAWLAGGVGLAGMLAAGLPKNTLLQGLAASTLLAYRGLDRAVGEVQAALARDDLEEARRLLGWHLVSRPTAELRADEVAAAAIESLAENLSDSVVAPLLAYLLAGLPGIAIYRLANTADAMWGYRNERYEQLGKATARLDDLFNLGPARLTAVVLALAAQITNNRGAAAWQIARRDAHTTASPNAGWPMATMAGALDTVLAKRGHYTLGNGARVPDVAMIAEARSIASNMVGLLIVALVAFCLPRRTRMTR